MAVSKYSELPAWSTINMNPCTCNGKTALFYDENENYRVKCTECNSTTFYKAKSMSEAKRIWNQSEDRNRGQEQI